MKRRPEPAMHVVRIVSRRGDREYVSYLLRTSFREGGKVKKRTLANLSNLPPDAIDLLRGHLAGIQYQAVGSVIQPVQSLPHGHVAAVIHKIRTLQLDRLLGRDCHPRRLALGMIAQRVVQPASKLATARQWRQSTLGQLLDVEQTTAEELYSAMDWLLERKPKVEAGLARRHLAEGCLVLCDVTSVYLEGSKCPLAKRGYSRDGRPDRPQIVVGLLQDREGRPVAAEVFAGNTADPNTLATQVDRLRKRFQLARVILVGDRGLLTEARIVDLKEKWRELDWVSCLRSPAIQALRDARVLQLSLFDERSTVEIVSPDHPGERLVACRNPLLAEERSRKREVLLAKTEAELEKISVSVQAGRLTDPGAIGLRVGRVVGRWKMGKHFRLEIGEGKLSWVRDEAGIRAESELDGVYVIRTSVPAEQLSAEAAVETYKRLSRAEQLFRMLKRMEIEIRPVHHHLEKRVRAHVFLCVLAAYVLWHLEQDWASLLYRDEERPRGGDPVAKAGRSEAARAKENTHHNADGLPVHSFRTLLSELGTLCRVELEVSGPGTKERFWRITEANELQRRAFELIGADPARM